MDFCVPRATRCLRARHHVGAAARRRGKGGHAGIGHASIWAWSFADQTCVEKRKPLSRPSPWMAGLNSGPGGYDPDKRSLRNSRQAHGQSRHPKRFCSTASARLRAEAGRYYAVRIYRCSSAEVSPSGRRQRKQPTYIHTPVLVPFHGPLGALGSIADGFWWPRPDVPFRPSFGGSPDVARTLVVSMVVWLCARISSGPRERLSGAGCFGCHTPSVRPRPSSLITKDSTILPYPWHRSNGLPWSRLRGMYLSISRLSPRRSLCTYHLF